jgi:signal transduction histidine kinase
MITSMTTADEAERLLDLYHYDLLDSAEEDDFDEIVQLASKICNTPISTVTLVDSHRQWFKAKVGLTATEDPREVSFCAHVVAGEEDIFTVEDASKDERFHDYPNVTGDPNIRFYAGVPLLTQRGHRIGALCVVNSKPQTLTEEQSFALRVLGRQVVKLAEQRLQNRYLQNYQKRLQQQAEMQNKILSIIAHDVRSPLVSLQGIVELSQENLLSEENKIEMMNMWNKQMDNTMCLLANLVEWGKVQAGSDVQKQQVVKLYDIVQDEFIKCGITANEKGNTLQNDIDPLFLVYCDENVLRFIIRNIITNAIKFTENGKIAVTSHRNKNKVSIVFSDSGMGMSEQQAKNLLSGNHYMVGLGTRNEKGSGLGFMLINDFVKMMDGEVRIDSAIGKGTTVTIDIIA